MRIWFQAAALGVVVILSSGCPGSDTGRTSSPSTLFTFETDYFEYLYRFHPTLGSRDGLHQYDGRLDDITPLRIGRRIDELKRLLLRLQALRKKELAPEEEVDAELIDYRIRAELLDLEHFESWRHNPLPYMTLLGVSLSRLMYQDYAPASQQLRAVIISLHEVSAITASMRGNVSGAAPELTRQALETAERTLSVLRTELPDWAKVAAGVDVALLESFNVARPDTEKALETSVHWLSNELLPVSTGDYALGREGLAMKLLFEEMLEVPIDRLVAIGEENLQRDYQKFVEVAGEIAPGKDPAVVIRSATSDHPSAGDLVAAAERAVASARQAVAGQAVLAIPDGAEIVVLETPAFLRSGFFTLRTDPPGAAESAYRKGWCYITPPSGAWSASRQAEHSRRFNPHDVLLAAVHEIYPGRYLQSLYSQQSRTRARQVLGCRSSAEGWAQYSEQMMIEEGYLAQDLKTRLAQLRRALVYDCRLLAGVKLHTEGMPVEEATRMFVDKAFQEPSVARQEAARAVSDPTYFVGVLGKMQILKLREDYRKAKGADYSLRRFHDDFIKHGTMPVKLVRESLLPGDDGPAL